MKKNKKSIIMAVRMSPETKKALLAKRKDPTESKSSLMRRVIERFLNCE